jgi:hypothetical protein
MRVPAVKNEPDQLYNTWVAWLETGMVIGVTVTTIIHKENKNEISHCKNVLSQMLGSLLSNAPGRKMAFKSQV